ncbi:MAG: OmpH family outer membrane protein, partial [Bdellovibrionales bacterium]|nr:OmpH family outer membrane protein [Bdellovibrionales bacterium]
MLFSTAAFGAESKFAYLDMQKAIQSVDQGKKAKKELETEFNAKKKKLEAKEKDLKEMGDDLEKKAMALSDEARSRKQREFQEEMLKYQKMVAQSQQEIQGRERELTAPILEKMKSVIEKLAQEEGFTMIFEKNEQSVIWAKKEVDITDKVIASFEKRPPIPRKNKVM